MTNFKEISDDELEQLMSQIVAQRNELQKLEDQVLKVQLHERLDAIRKIYSNMMNVRCKQDQELHYLNEQLLYAAISSYYDDIYRFKDYSGSKWADSHKQAGYLIKWISRFRPIQIRENQSLSCDNVISINAIFALFVGFSFLKPCVAQNITKEMFDHLIYT